MFMLKFQKRQRIEYCKLSSIKTSLARRLLLVNILLNNLEIFKSVLFV